MELKDYQIKVLDYLEAYLLELKKQEKEKQSYFDFQKRNGKEAVPPGKSDYCQLAWEALKAKLPVHHADYTVRNDGMGRNIPNICFKVPTGGGKTLLATAAIQRINQDYFELNNGFVLWIVPSDTIYTQTSKQLRDKEHPYRQMLDRASGGRTLILEKSDKFSAQDVKDNLCVMLLMLQASNRENKNTLKMFKDSGQFESFFPPLDDYNANDALLNVVPNLDMADYLSEDGYNVISGIAIRHSLGNVMRLLRPITIFDEGHRGATELAQNTVNSFNTAFIVELSATPKDHSNVLVNVGGQELKKEQMIKLPINVISYGEENWQHTLNQAHSKTIELNKLATKYQADEGRYIRPIMVIKAEPKKKGETYDHVEEIKSYLIKTLHVLEAEIRIKLSGKNELRDDDLFDKLCSVRYIITKDALKEGWDCSFAYVLTILSNSKSETALTQFIGRVLRQPHALETTVAALNQCYVYCDNADVNSTVEGVKKGLENEGLGDVSNQIETGGGGQATGKAPLERTEKYRGTKIFLPSLNVIRDGKPASFDYYADILGDIQWDKYNFKKLDNIELIDKENMDHFQLKVDFKKETQAELDFLQREKVSEQITNDVSITLMVSQLMEKIPNAWQAFRIIDCVLSDLKARGESEAKIVLNSVFIVEEIKRDCFSWLIEKSEAIFREKLNNGVVFLHLLAEPFSTLNWQMADKIEVQHDSNEIAVTLEKSMFERQYLSNYNNLEKSIALAINNKDVVQWWHRLAVRGTEYSIQGWKREKIYPDFLVKMEAGKDGIERMYFVESKGEHLEGNKDTRYKKDLFDTINASLSGDIKPKGELELINSKDNISFHMVFQYEWENELNKLLVV